MRWPHIVLTLALTFAAHAPLHAAPRGEGYPKLFGMNIGAKNYDNPGYIEAMSRLDIVILGFHPGWRGDKRGERIGAAVHQLLERNPSLIVGQYTILNESTDDPVKGAANRDRIEKLDREGWWLRRSDGHKVAWTAEYGAYDINFTEWSKPDRNGDRYPQWLAKRNAQSFFDIVPEFGIWYLDNVMVRSRVPQADWKRNGENQSNKDPAIEAAYRRGVAAHVDAIRRLKPRILLVANADNDLSSPEYRGKFDGVFLEGLMGKSWSLERTRGWGEMMKRYLDVRGNLRGPAIVAFNVSGNAQDYRFFRYAFCSSLLGDGYFSFNDARAEYSTVAWFDEYDVRIGKPLDPPQTAPASNGVYRRRFEHALALVNPGDAPRTIALEPGWQRFRGQQAPAVNSGEAATQVTLQPRDGLLLVRP